MPASAPEQLIVDEALIEVSRPVQPASARDDPRRSIRQLSLVAAIAAIAFGVAIGAGYVFSVGRLLPLPQFVLPTQPLVAVLFIVTGGSLLALSKILGHSSVAITQEVYAHLHPDAFAEDYSRVSFAMPDKAGVVQRLRA